MLNWINKLFSASEQPANMPAAAGAEACKVRGNAHFAQGELADALACYRQAVAIDPGFAEAHNNQGIVLLQLGQVDEALAVFRHTIALQPGLAQAHVNCGNAYRSLGQPDNAQACFEKAIALNPQLPEVHNNLGHLLYEQGRFDDAQASLRKALAIRPDFAEAHNNLAHIFHEQGKLDEAAACYRQALSLRPDIVDAYNNLGHVYQTQGKLDDAIDCFRKVLALNPDFAGAYTNLGNVLQNCGRVDEAIDSHQMALSLQPDCPQTLSNLGVALQKAGKLDEAIANHGKALALQPDFPVALNNLGVALQERGRLDEAIASFRKALAFKSDYADAYCNLGNALHKCGKADEALACLKQALALDPGLTEAHNSVGILFQKSGLLDEALDSLRKAQSLKPDYAKVHNNLGNVLQEQGRLEEAVTCYREALALKPDYAEAHSNLLFCLNYHPDLPADAIFAEYQRWNELHALPLRPREQPHANTRDPLRRLRIGYVSPDLRQHSARHFIEPLLAHHDKTQVEVFAYAQVAVEDGVSATFKGYVDHWRNTVGLSDDEMAQSIRQDGIDILVDLAGHTANHRLLVFARKPAPIQMSWMGYGYTTGVDAIDYFIADREFAPPGCETLFAEKLLYLPVYAAYRPAQGMGEPGPLPALQTGSVTFGTLTRSIRVNHRVVDAWAAILHRLPSARLLINSGNFRSPGMQARMADQFAAHDIPAHRLILGFDTPPWDVMRRIDISLDCFPHNSGTTLFESLYMGLPYITLAGRPSVGRLGAAILSGCGHPEWITDSTEDYVDKAVELASDIDRLAGLRADLRDRMQHSLLMDEPAFVHSIEAAYRSAWQQWCGQTPP